MSSAADSNRLTFYPKDFFKVDGKLNSVPSGLATSFPQVNDLLPTHFTDIAFDQSLRVSDKYCLEQKTT